MLVSTTVTAYGSFWKRFVALVPASTTPWWLMLFEELVIAQSVRGAAGFGLRGREKEETNNNFFGGNF